MPKKVNDPLNLFDKLKKIILPSFKARIEGFFPTNLNFGFLGSHFSCSNAIFALTGPFCHGHGTVYDGTNG